jgi:lipopolysaccharide transport system ATP-binding protein
MQPSSPTKTSWSSASDRTVRIDPAPVELRDVSLKFVSYYDKSYSLKRAALDLILRREGPAPVAEFWALRNVDLRVGSGERLGIVGHNGAGKSTLLKILSRITEPTTGRVTLRGRVASLLEVGTGFHPELTGRENIFLNGAILGMSRAEIKRKFDEIVAFAEVEKFLDSPVKRYSSGMYVRLAFAVAAHLEPEILIVDEVLAVGDAEFQKKCLGKMQDVAAGGRTVLFVSHNMAAVSSLCKTAMVLEQGRCLSIGEAAGQVASYIRATSTSGRRDFVRRELSSDVSLHHLSLSPNPIVSGGRCKVEVQLSSTAPTRVRELVVLLFTQAGMRVAILDLRGVVNNLELQPGELSSVTTEIGSLPLVEGEYSLGLYIHAGELRGDFFDLLAFTVAAIDPGRGPVPYAAANRGIFELSYESNVTSAELHSAAPASRSPSLSTPR